MTSTPRLAIVRLPHAAGLDLPAYETDGAAGLDLRAAVPEDRPLILPPGRRAAVPTGLVLELPDGHEGQVRPRSGLALKHGITCLNTPGSIDSDYRGGRMSRFVLAYQVGLGQTSRHERQTG